MTQAPLSSAPNEGNLTEWLLRLFAVAAYVFFLWNIGRSWLAEPTRLTLLALLVTESVSLIIVIFARRATQRDMSLLSISATIYACFFFVLLGIDGTSRYIPEWLGFSFQAVGLVVQLTSKLVLGRCFGLLPAVRGIVTRGPYRWVRHPIYGGYLIAHLAFLAANFSVRNLGVLSLLYAAQVWRMHREEFAMSANKDYLEYMQRVRWRLVPGIY